MPWWYYVGTGQSNDSTMQWSKSKQTQDIAKRLLPDNLAKEEKHKKESEAKEESKVSDKNDEKSKVSSKESTKNDADVDVDDRKTTTSDSKDEKKDESEFLNQT